jgi:hypothetical protein
VLNRYSIMASGYVIMTFIEVNCKRLCKGMMSGRLREVGIDKADVGRSSRARRSWPR